MKFRLKSPYQPTGDQPQAIEMLSECIEAENKHQTLLGVTGSGKTFTLANVIEKTQKPTLVISHNKTLAAQLYQEFRDYFPDNAVSYFVSYYDYYQPEAYIPSSDTYIEKETDVNQEIDKLRLSATANLLSRPDVIVVASVSCIYNLGSPLEFAKNYLELTPGQKISQTTIINRLVDIQYVRNDYELRRGSFRVKGESLQVWPADSDQALRIELLAGEIGDISMIDPTSGEVVEDESDQKVHGPKRYIIYPAKHYLTNTKNQSEVLKEIKTDLAHRLQELKEAGRMVEAYRLGQKVKYDLEMIQELGYVNGIENYSRYFDGRNPGDPPYTLLDYFRYNASAYGANGESSTFLTIIDESHITLPQLRGMHAGDQSRKQTLIDYGFRLSSALDNRPLKFDEIMKRLDQVIYASATPEVWELNQSQDRIAEQLIRPTGLVDPEIEIRPTKGQVPDLIREIIKRVSRGQRVLITTLTKRMAEDLSEYLNSKDKIRTILEKYDDKSIDKDISPKVAYLHADVDTLDRSDILESLRKGEYDVVVGINLLREGLDLPEVSLVAILDADKQGFLRSTNSLIQTMGRAARHVEGRVIMYADVVSKSMQAAIDEVGRRRKIQTEYNRKHRIVPRGVEKPVREKLLERNKDEDVPIIKPIKEFKHLGWHNLHDIDPHSLTPQDRKKLAAKLTRLMKQAAKEWEFEQAAYYRNAVRLLKDK